MDYLIIALIVVYSIYIVVSSLVAVYVVGEMLFEFLKPVKGRKT